MRKIRYRTYKCRHCGFTFSDIDDIEENALHTGFWCPDCDGFTTYDGSVPARLDVFLESKTFYEPDRHSDGVPGLDGRLSPLRYPGGKGRLLKQLAPFLPAHAGLVVEPFAGGASVSLAMLLSGRAERIQINDTDPGIYAFWVQALFNTDAFFKDLGSVQGVKEEFKEAKKVLNKGSTNEAEIAKAFIIVNQLAFSGVTTAGLAGDYTKRWNLSKIEQRVRLIAQYKDRITVTKQDALEVIEERYWDPDCFLFIDPPYVLQGKRLYRKWYRADDHLALAELIRSLTSTFPGCAQLMVTYDECGMTEQLYTPLDGVIHHVARRYSCGCR